MEIIDITIKVNTLINLEVIQVKKTRINIKVIINNININNLEIIEITKLKIKIIILIIIITAIFIEKIIIKNTHLMKVDIEGLGRKILKIVNKVFHLNKNKVIIFQMKKIIKDLRNKMFIFKEKGITIIITLITIIILIIIII
jgi:hypothetical protein